MLKRFIKDELNIFHQNDMRPWFEIEIAINKFMEENNMPIATKEQHVEFSKKRYKKNKK